MELKNKRWILKTQQPGPARELAQRLGTSELLARLLINRGVEDVESARLFLQPRLTGLHDPFLLPDMEKACDRICRAIRGGEKIVIYGDYDADGVTATALLLKCFRLARANVEYYLPTRFGEGYGLNAQAVKKIAESGAKVIVTVDCGVNACEEARLARQHGVDLVITDHHEFSGERPEALAVISPGLPWSEYPFRYLAGVGVAFKLAWAVGKSLSGGMPVSERFKDFLMDALGLAALGTIADVVPLNGENRIIARYGLKALAESSSPGIRALLDISGAADKPMDTWDVGFRLGPRLNVAGRLGDARRGVELLTTESASEAKRLAEELDAENDHRKKIQEEILGDAVATIEEKMDPTECRVIVLAREGWHTGVVGIVASKIAEEFHRPAILIAMDGEEGHGSARSIHGVHLLRLIERCGEHLTGFGGHAQAAGLSLRKEDIEPFIRSVQEFAREIISDELLVPSIEADTEAYLPGLTDATVEEIGLLAPYGEGNEAPILVSKDVSIAGVPRRVGREGKHLKFYAHQGTATLDAIAFSMGEYAPLLADKKHRWAMAYTPVLDDWGGRLRVQLQIKDIKLHE